MGSLDCREQRGSPSLGHCLAEGEEREDVTEGQKLTLHSNPPNPSRRDLAEVSPCVFFPVQHSLFGNSFLKRLT